MNVVERNIIANLDLVGLVNTGLIITAPNFASLVNHAILLMNVPPELALKKGAVHLFLEHTTRVANVMINVPPENAILVGAHLPSNEGRCGPKFNDRECTCTGYEIYCNSASGWCGDSPAHRNAQKGFDGEFFVKQEYGGVGSGPGIIISHQAPQS